MWTAPDCRRGGGIVRATKLDCRIKAIWPRWLLEPNRASGVVHTSWNCRLIDDTVLAPERMGCSIKTRR
jgi:hypothetical protein